MIRKKNLLFYVFAFTMVATLSFLIAKNVSQSKAYTDGFNAGNIISDAAMRDYNSLSEWDIQTFLKSKNSCNDTALYKTGNNVDYLSENSPYSWHVRDGHYVCMADETFNGGTAAHIIYQAAQDYHINPKVLIVLLEKEQSLVRDTFPNSVQYRSATGFGCPDSDVCSSEYYGLNNQIRNAASMFNEVLNGGWTNYPVGWNYIQYNPKSWCNGSNVYIENLATSALYRYTPYQPGGDASQDCGAYGNINFYNFYTDWFGSTQQVFKSSDLGNIYVPDGTYQIQTNTGFNLNVDNGSTHNGANINIWPADGDSAFQRFKIIRQSDGFYKILNPISGKYLDVNGASKLPGANVQIWTGNSTCAQEWAITIKSGKYIIRNACAGTTLDVYGGNIRGNGSNVDVYTYHGGESEQWNLISMEQAVIEDGNYIILSAGGKALDVYGGKAKDGANIGLWSPHRRASEQFTIARERDGFYRISNINTDKSLDVYGASVKPGANVNMWTNNNNCSQKWELSKNKYGIFYIRNACAGNALDVYGNVQISDGSNVDTWTFHKGISEQWTLVPVSQNQDYLTVGEYQIASPLGQVLDVYGAQISNGANVSTWSTHAGSSETFRFEKTSDGFFRIINVNANKSLDVYGASTKSGANVNLWTNNNSCSQKWYLMPYDDKFYIRNACSGNALDIYGGQNKLGSNVDVWSFHGGVSELWTLVSR